MECGYYIMSTLYLLATREYGASDVVSILPRVVNVMVCDIQKVVSFNENSESGHDLC